MLTLTIENAASLASGDPTHIELDRRGVLIGRAPHADWTLSDPANFISSEHCEIDYRDGAYWLGDRSTNGTFVNGARERVGSGGQQLRDGDLIAIGHYQVRVGLPEAARPGATPESRRPAWAGTGADTAAAAQRTDAFGLPPARPIFEQADDPMLGSFAPPPASPGPPPGGDPFGLGGSAAPLPMPSFPPAMAPSWTVPAGPTVEPWTRPTSTPVPPSAAPAPSPAENVWGKLYASASVGGWTQPAAEPVTAPASPSLPEQAPLSIPGVAQDAYQAFLRGAGLAARDFDTQPPARILAAAGELLRLTAEGLIRLLDARARVRQQFGVQQRTEFRPGGNNALKWTRQPEQALRQLLGEPDRGFEPGPDALRGAFGDLQAHELAMIAAMQDALKATMARFAPDAIRARAKRTRGLGRLLPGAPEAQLWAAYERDYRSVADESEAAYLDLFAKYFRAAYERADIGTGTVSR